MHMYIHMIYICIQTQARKEVRKTMDVRETKM